MKASRVSTIVCLIVTLLFLVTICGGCAPLKSGSEEELAGRAAEQAEGYQPVYYDFGDVLLPSQLEVDKDRSFVSRSPGLTAGILTLTGRVEVNSLIRFFENNMAKDNWRLVTSFKAPRTLMFFSKPNRNCIISMTEKRLNTEVEIWVAPTTEEGEATLVK